jgi:hypothetical protein
MVVLKKRKEEEVMKDVEIREVKPVPPAPQEKPASEVVEKPKEEKSIPLFVKLDKYKSILGIINDIKSILFFVKNSLLVQKQIESLLEENKKVLEEAIQKMDEKIAMLERELIKPGLYEARKEEAREESKDLDNTLEELKKQIESLKEDLKNIA